MDEPAAARAEEAEATGVIVRIREGCNDNTRVETPTLAFVAKGQVGMVWGGVDCRTNDVQ